MKAANVCGGDDGDGGDGKEQGDGDGDEADVVELNSYARELFSKIFDQFASSYREPPIGDKVMTAEDVTRWLHRLDA